MKKIEQIQSRDKNLFLLRKTKKQFSNNSKIEKISKLGIFGNKIIPVPIELDLIEGNYISECHDFFEKIESICDKGPKCIYLSFRNTEVLKAMPTLILYSIIDYAREKTKSNIKVNLIWSKKSSIVNNFILNTGSFINALERESKINDNKSLPVIMGDNSRANDLSNIITDFILDNYFKDATPEKEQQISSAIQETVDNVGRHAYPTISEHYKKKWWLCCHRIGENLFLAIYDKGIGIPKSLSVHNAVLLSRINSLYPEQATITDDEETNTLDDSKRKLSAFVRVNLLKERLTDGQLIRAAMHTDISATQLPKHGQGSKSIKGLISEHDDNSFLLLLSNKGFYCYSKKENDSEKNVTHREYIIPGTLIQWSI